MKYVKFHFNGKFRYGKVINVVTIPQPSATSGFRRNLYIIEPCQTDYLHDKSLFYNYRYNCHTFIFHKNELAKCSKAEYMAAMVLES